MKDRKILWYILNVDWNSIKQRPHHMALDLADDYDVHVFYRFPLKPSSRTVNHAKGIKTYPLLPVPRSINLYFEKIDPIIQSIWLKLLALGLNIKKPDIIVVSYPTHYKYLTYFSGECIKIYDCMDDASEFYEDTSRSKLISSHENSTLRWSTFITCTSANLVKVVEDKLNNLSIERPTYLIRNGVNSKWIDNLRSEELENLENNNGVYKIAYFGAISWWFDFEIIGYVLSEFPDLEFHLIGPLEGEKQFEHPRVKYYGSVENSKLYDFVKQFDAFIMPFKINKLILSVDPIKLYEYIATGKEVISVYYPEIDRFRNVINFYEDGDGLVKIIKHLKDKIKNTSDKEDRINFLEENTWRARSNTLKGIINSYLGKK